jgi:hypothetical protein
VIGDFIGSLGIFIGSVEISLAHKCTDYLDFRAESKTTFNIEVFVDIMFIVDIIRNTPDVP